MLLTVNCNLGTNAVTVGEAGNAVSQSAHEATQLARTAAECMGSAHAIFPRPTLRRGEGGYTGPSGMSGCMGSKLVGC